MILVNICVLLDFPQKMCQIYLAKQPNKIYINVHGLHLNVAFFNNSLHYITKTPVN